APAQKTRHGHPRSGVDCANKSISHRPLTCAVRVTARSYITRQMEVHCVMRESHDIAPKREPGERPGAAGQGDGPREVTRLLLDWSRGDVRARDELMPLVYGELRRRAAPSLRRERTGHTLVPTALVHEAYLRMVDQRSVVWQNRAHFFAIAAQLMRRVLFLHRGGKE